MNTFKTQEELHRFLLEGGTIEYIESGDDNVILNYQDGQICYQDGRKASFHFSKPDEWKPYVKKEWYEQIHEGGVWCKNSDDNIIEVIKFTKKDLITEYVKKHYQPITKEFYEEMGKHIYEY